MEFVPKGLGLLAGGPCGPEATQYGSILGIFSIEINSKSFQNDHFPSRMQFPLKRYS
jgi:hypothetical protein